MSELKKPSSESEHSPHGSDRRRVLVWSSAALLGALAFSGTIPGLSLGEALAQSAGGPKTRGDTIDLGEGDVGVLNYAYALEQLEAAFYTQVLKTAYSGMESGDRDMLTAIRNHEIAHRELFKAALKKNAIPDLEVDFTKVDFNSRDSVLSTARTFEDLGVAAYNGAGQLLEKGEYLLLAGKIVSVEARHASAIRGLMMRNRSAGGNNQTNSAADDAVDEKGLDKAMLPSEVLPLAAPFIKTKVSANELA